MGGLRQSGDEFFSLTVCGRLDYEPTTHKARVRKDQPEARYRALLTVGTHVRLVLVVCLIKPRHAAHRR